MIRVFPRRTAFTPTDEFAFVGDPPLWRPEADDVHISCTFTWDIVEAERLVRAWSQYYPVVKLGGPAFGSPVDGFESGLYVREGVVFTTRGCNKRCPFCLVPEREGKLRLLDVTEGYIIQDNNLLQAPRSHIEKVFTMLKRQGKAAVFSGGIDSTLVDEWFVNELRGIRVNQLFLACDTDRAIRPLRRAVERLSFLGCDKLRCYVLIGYNGESPLEAEARLREVWEAGCMPFAQLYQPPSDKKINYSQQWRDLARTWSRPAAMKALMNDGQTKG